MIGFPMLPGTAGMAQQGYGMMQGQPPYLPQDPSTFDYFQKGWGEAGGLQSLPGILQQVISEKYGGMFQPPAYDPRFDAMNMAPNQDGGLLSLLGLSDMANNPQGY